MTNIIRRVYIDTSVVGGTFDKEFARQTEPFWRAVQNGNIRIIISDILRGEMQNAPQHVRTFFDSLLEHDVEHVLLSQEAEDLAERYLFEKVVGGSSLDDARHIAIATVCRADVLVSWNFKHIVNLNRIRGYHSVNLRQGYPMIEIRTPPESMDYENDE